MGSRDEYNVSFVANSKLYDELEKMSRKLGATKSFIIRRALKKYIEGEEL